MANLLNHTGKVLATDTYNEAVEKIKATLRKPGNRTSAVLKLFKTVMLWETRSLSPGTWRYTKHPIRLTGETTMRRRLLWMP